MLRWEPSNCRLGVVMNISGVEATGSGRSRAEYSEARAQVACYGARPGRAGQAVTAPGPGKAETASLKERN